MLASLEASAKDKTARHIDYVIVHKLDRLARDRADDVAIALAVRNAGATLVSVAEQIDETPAGMLLHGIMATIAEYYSRNLASEAKKGMERKAKMGGTHGVAPIGYLNTTARVDGHEIKGVEFDPERADHIRWAFQEYATGRWSIATITEALAERGLRSRSTKAFPGTPLSDSQVHRLLHNVYYMGKIVYRGMILDGAHHPLVDPVLWFKVQDVLDGRRLAGDRSWRHFHYLKGSLVCARCSSRLGYGHSKGRGGTYAYFFCLGRHTKRTDCKMPYIPAEKLETLVLTKWQRVVQFTEEELERTEQLALEELDKQFENSEAVTAQQHERLIRLERTKQKLIDAYVADALPITDLKARQMEVAREIADAKQQIGKHRLDREELEQRLNEVLALVRIAGDLYDQATPEARQMLNQAVFEYLAVNYEDPDDPEPSEATQAGRPALSPKFSAPVAAVRALAQKTPDVADSAATPPKPRSKNKEAPGSLLLTGGSNVRHLAETEGFEPSVPRRGLHLSRVVH